MAVKGIDVSYWQGIIDWAKGPLVSPLPSSRLEDQMTVSTPTASGKPITRELRQTASQ